MATKITNFNTPNDRWNELSKLSKTDHAIKKFVLGFITLVNLAAIGALFTYLTLYFKIPDQAYFVSPFIGGVLAALAFLKVPTCGINQGNYRDLQTPSTILGKIITYILFGPTVILQNSLDWMEYNDPYVAREIKRNFESYTFVQMMENYVWRSKNLEKYGMLSKESAKQLQKLETYTTTIKTYHLLLRDKPELKEEDYSKEFKKKMDQGKSDWETIKTAIKNDLPFPDLPEPSFSACTTLHFTCSKALKL